MIGDLAMTHPQHAVEIGILGQPPIVECPGQIIKCLLHILDRLINDLRIEVIIQLTLQDTLHRVRIEQESLVVLFSGGVAHDHALAPLVNSVPARSSDHLQKIGYAVVVAA